MKEHINNIEEFKKYATSSFVPNYFKNYVNALELGELKWFYEQVKNVLAILTDEGYLIYKFQWIRVREFRDLTKEIYIEYLYNPEGVKFNIFKPGWEEKLDDKYQYDKDVLRFYRLS